MTSNFDEILELIDKKWLNQNYKNDLLPGICMEVFESFNLHESIDSILSSKPIDPLLNCRPHPANGVITLAETPSLNLYLHFWFEDIGTPHHHAWHGFFMNLKGSVLHSVYEYKTKEVFGPNLNFGEVSTKKTELLLPGDRLPVYPGKKYIHGLWHIDSPCISLSVRSKSLKFPSDQLTLDYDRLSGVAMSKVERREDVGQLNKWLQMTYKIDKNQYYNIIDDLINNKDATTVFFLLDTLIRRYNDLDLADHIRNQNYDIDGSLVKRYVDFSEGLARNELFIDLRLGTKNYGLRALYGALYLASNLGGFFDTLQKIYPSDQVYDKAEQLLYNTVSTMAIENASDSVKDTLKGYFKSILSKDIHHESLHTIESNISLSEEEKRLLMNTINGIEESIIFKPLFQ